MTTMYLNELQIDALKEVINVGVGYAASSLNELVERPISLCVLSCVLVSHLQMLSV